MSRQLWAGSGNSGFGDEGVGIFNSGTLAVRDSIVEGNVIFNDGVGAGIASYGGKVTLTSSTVDNNSIAQADDPPKGAGLYGSTFAVTNSLVSNNTTSPSGLPTVEDDCDGVICPANGADGNLIGAGFSSSLPGSALICAGLLADLPADLTLDFRGTARTSNDATAAGNVTCLDSGALQTHYSLSFTKQPPSTIAPGATFTVAVQLLESGTVLRSAGIPIQLALAAGDHGTLRGGSAVTDANGVATFSQVSIDTPGAGDILVASVMLTSTPLPVAVSAPVYATAVSSPFAVTSPNAGISLTAAPTTLILRAGASGQVSISVS